MTIMTSEEAAMYLRYSNEGFYKLLSRGQVPGAFKVGSLWKIKKEALDEFIKDQSEKSVRLEKTHTPLKGRSKNHGTSDSAGA